MKLLIVSATALEIKPLLGLISSHPTLKMSLHRGTYKHLFVDVLISGVGIMSTAYHLGDHFAKMKYDLVIQVGIGGSFSKRLALGELVEVYSEEIGDWGADSPEGFIPMKSMGFFNPNQFPFTQGSLINPHIGSDAFPDVSLPAVKSVSVNKVSGTEAGIKALLAHCPAAEVESMEGAAFFYACLQADIPFFQIRAISNYVEVRNKDNWEMPLAIERLNGWCMRYLNKLT